MTREQYGQAYQKGFNLTVRFLVSRGLAYDSAQETAQAAWVKGWERLSQLRDPSMVLTWMNSIALNIHRSYIRREPLLQTLPELSTSPKINLAAIDVRRILKSCKHNDRMVLQRHYLEGFKVQEIAEQQGWTKPLSASDCCVLAARLESASAAAIRNLPQLTSAAPLPPQRRKQRQCRPWSQRRRTWIKKGGRSIDRPPFCVKTAIAVSVSGLLDYDPHLVERPVDKDIRDYKEYCGKRGGKSAPLLTFQRHG